MSKTQLAIEYAHGFASSYDVAWWVNAERAGLIGDQFAGVGGGAWVPGAGRAVLSELRDRGRWLLSLTTGRKPRTSRIGPG